MLLCIQMVTDGLGTFRGIARCLEAFAQWFDIPTPSPVTLQNWVMRLGAYLLERQLPFQGDWVLIPDHTVQQGKEKCLVLLGVPTKALENNIKLKHTDVQVLSILPQENATGETVLEAFQETAGHYGPPAYIVSDKGSDLAKGIRLYCEDHPETAEIYDITHDMALQLKKELEDDLQWKAFSKCVAQTSQETRQTELLFLAPNAMRTKSRFLNLGGTLTWAEKILAYSKLDDFDDIGTGYFLNEEQVSKLRIYNGMNQLEPLHQLQDRHFPDKETFLSALKSLPGDLPESLCRIVLVAADKNRERFTQKFGWLEGYREDVDFWSQIYLATQLAMIQVKEKGLNHMTVEELRSEFSQKLKPTSERAIAFCERVLTCVQDQANKVPKGSTWLGTSDIIESIFGKAKIFSNRTPLKTINASILTIPVFTEELSPNLVKEAMENFSMERLRKLCRRLFGVSAFNKRNLVFSRLQKVGDMCDQLELDLAP